MSRSGCNLDDRVIGRLKTKAALDVMDAAASPRIRCGSSVELRVVLAAFAAILGERGAPVHGAADVHQDGAAAVRRRAVGVVGGDGVLPGRAARGLRLRASAEATLSPGTRSVVIHLGVMVAAISRCRSRSPRVGTGRRRGRGVLAHRAVRGLDRPAVLCARRDAARCCRPGSPHRPSGTPRTPIFSMPPAMSAASSRCCPTRSRSSPSCGSAIRQRSGRSALVSCS